MQSGLLVLDQVGHDLDDRGFDGSAGSSKGVVPVHRGRRIPLVGGGLGVEPGRQVGPDGGLVRQVGAGQRRTAGFDQGASSRQTPRWRRVGDHAVGSGAAGSLGVTPAVLLDGALYQDEAGRGDDLVTLAPSPRHQVQPQVRIGSGHHHLAADRHASKGLDDQQMAALVEAESFKVDSRQR